jgi:polyphosphate glucokinase
VSEIVLGVDVGGSSIKFAEVNVRTGALQTELGIKPTPQPATRGALLDVLAQLSKEQPGSAAIGLALPSVIRAGTIQTAANLDATLIGLDVEQQLQQLTGRSVRCLNDADAAGLAEVHGGAAKGVAGVVMVLTFGTGIGSALFVDGRLVPNTELGHLQLDGAEAELRASARAKSVEGLNWSQWAQRVNAYLKLINDLFWPELIVMAGAVSAEFSQYSAQLHSRAPVRPATFAAAAGVVGAAMASAGILS